MICPNARVDLRQVLVAALTSLGGDTALAGAGELDSRTIRNDTRSESNYFGTKFREKSDACEI